MAYIIVIDGGGTKTRGRVYDLEGNLLQEHLEDFANPMVDFDLTVAHIFTCIKELLQVEMPIAVVMGIAGSSQKKCHDQLFEAIKNQTLSVLKQAQLILVDDLVLSHYATFKGEEGILGLLGTGSAVLTYQNDHWIRMGGFGHIIGDEGSGYVLAVEVVKEAIRRSYNGDHSLESKIINFFDLTCMEDIKEIVYRLPKSKLASLSTKVFEWEIAEKLSPIIDQQILAFSEIMKAMVLKTVKPSATDPLETYPIKINLIGGMVLNNGFYYERLKTQIKKMCYAHQVEINCVAVDACEGGLHLYNKACNISFLEDSSIEEV